VSTVGDWLAAHAELPRLDRELLVCRAAGISRSQVIGRPERVLGVEALVELNKWATRRQAGEPLAYITGEKEFWGLTFEVSPSVLVPRPDTELLVETALELASEAMPQPSASGRWIELGTGSGAVVVALGREAAARGWPVALTATDRCPAALAQAACNAARHHVSVTWRCADWFDGIDGAFDLIISNPPYVADGDPHLDDLGYEPRHALTAGADGLDDLRRIAAGVYAYLRPGGWVALEHGAYQGTAVRALLREAGLYRIDTVTDLAGRERVTRARRPERAATDEDVEPCKN
jgi:release factor glutamine methyltransferase